MSSGSLPLEDLVGEAPELFSWISMSGCDTCLVLLGVVLVGLAGGASCDSAVSIEPLLIESLISLTTTRRFFIDAAILAAARASDESLIFVEAAIWRVFRPDAVCFELPFGVDYLFGVPVSRVRRK